MFNVLLYCAGMLTAYMTVVFLIALLKRDNNIVDIAWCIGGVLVALGLLAYNDYTASPRQYLATLLILLWGTRLSLHLFYRSFARGKNHPHPELGGSRGDFAVLGSFFQIFIPQAAIVLLLTTPIMIIAAQSDMDLKLGDALGASVWTVGFVFEAISDWQLRQFKRQKKNRNRIIKTGLWQYSQHPNYFGEVAMWVGIFIISLSVPYGWMGIVSPLLVIFRIFGAGGIPLLEKRFASSRGYAEYKKNTSFFLPGFRKKPGV